MKENTTALLALAFAVSSGFATADITVGYHEYGGVKVSSGEQTLSENVTTGDGGYFSKTGEGKLTVPLSRVNQSVSGWELRTHEGTMRVEAGADATAATAPAVIAAKACLWLDADSVVTTNGTDGTEYAKKWVDVRDRESPDSTTRIYATPAWGTLAPEDSLNRPPVLVTTNGTKALYFGGNTSGKYMKLSSDITTIREQFVVHGAYDCWGAVIGCSTTRSGMITDTYAGSLALANCTGHFSLRAELSSAYASARYHLDGVEFSPYTTPPKCGFQLLDCEFPLYRGSFNQIFRCGFETVASGTTDKKVQGGDFVSEIIVFTNVITEAERVEVERYLMRKWSLPKADAQKRQVYLPAQGAIVTAASATTELSAGADETLPLVDLRGCGTVKKVGAGTLAVGPSRETSQAYDFQLDAGTILSRGGRPPAVKASSGDRFNGAVYTPYAIGANRAAGVDITAGATLTRTSDAGAGYVIKEGNDWVRVNEVADGVKTIDVRAGVFALEAKTHQANEYAVERPVSVANSDFELGFAVDTVDSQSRGTLNGNAQNGWTGSSYYIAWTNSDSQTWFGYSDSKVTPSSGNHAVLLNGTVAQTTITIPEDGWYEVVFRAKERYGNGSTKNDNISYGSVYWGASTESLSLVGKVYPSGYGFARYTARLPYSKSGEYVLRFSDTRTGADGSLLIDDIAVRALGQNPEVASFKVPNGDFETLDMQPSKPYLIGQYTICNVPTGWTLDVSETTIPEAKTNSAVGVAAPAFSLGGGAFMFSGLWNLLPGANRLFFFYNGGKASTSFTAPAGTYRLRADAARHNCYLTPSGGYTAKSCTDAPIFAATLTLQDKSVVNLGNVTKSSFLASEAYWPTEFTLESEQTVTLTITQTAGAGAGWVDNLGFVAVDKFAERQNLIVCPGAEATDWSTSVWKASADTSFFLWSSAGYREYNSTTTKNYGYAALEGDRFFFIRNLATLKQTVAVPAPGLYRLKLHVKTRADGTNYAGNDLWVWCHPENAKTTNTIDKLLMHYTGNFLERSYLINFPAKGNYDIGISSAGIDQSLGVKADKESHFDDISLKKVEGTVDSVPTMPRVSVRVAAGSRLVLDFPGRVTVRSLKLGSTSVHGVVRADDYPEYLGGIGEIEVVSDGLIIFCK